MHCSEQQEIENSGGSQSGKQGRDAKDSSDSQDSPDDSTANTEPLAIPSLNFHSMTPDAFDSSQGQASKNKGVRFPNQGEYDAPWGPVDLQLGLRIPAQSTIENILKYISPHIVLKINEAETWEDLALIGLIKKLSALGYQFYLSYGDLSSLQNKFNNVIGPVLEQVSKNIYIELRVVDENFSGYVAEINSRANAEKINWIMSDNLIINRDNIVKVYQVIKPPQLFAVSVTYELNGSSPAQGWQSIKNAFDTCFDFEKDISGSSSTKLNHSQGAGLIFDFSFSEGIVAQNRVALQLAAASALSTCHAQANLSKSDAQVKMITLGSLADWIALQDPARHAASINQLASLLPNGNSKIYWPVSNGSFGDIYKNSFISLADTHPIVGIYLANSQGGHLFVINFSDESYRVEWESISQFSVIQAFDFQYHSNNPHY